MCMRNTPLHSTNDYYSNLPTELTTCSSTAQVQCGAIGLPYPPQVTEKRQRLSWPTLDPQVTAYLLNGRQELQATEAREEEKVLSTHGVS